MPNLRPGSKSHVRRVLDALYQTHGRVRGKPGRDPVGGLVGTILSQHTSDINSERAYESLRVRFATWDEVAGAPVRLIEAAIRCGGLAKQKAPRIRAVLREIRDRYGTITLDALGKQRTPELLDALTAFHGVGKKTAACVALFELGRDVCPVDTHVHRIVKRLGWVSERVSADAAFDELAGRLPAGEAHEAHIALIRHGRTLCRPRPRCRECAVRRLCPSAE